MNLFVIGKIYVDNDNKILKCIYIQNEQIIFEWINLLCQTIAIRRNTKNGYHNFILLQYTDDEYIDYTDDEYLSDPYDEY